MTKITQSSKGKTCRYCKGKFTQKYSLQVVCDAKCAIGWVTKKREQKERKELRFAKARLKTRAQHLKEAQTVFNQFIRLRDQHEPCISCQRHHTGQYHAGHYRTVGAMPQLRFSELNAHKQCSACNNYLSGNIVEYRINLINKIGLERVEWLESQHEPKKYTLEEIIALKVNYKNKIKELQFA